MPTALFVSAILLGVYALYWSSEYKSCIHQEPGYQEQNKHPSTFVISIRRPNFFLKCTWVVLHKNHETLIAIGTIFLALFTTTLWWATRRLVGHAVEIERAYVSGGFGEKDTANRLCAGINNYGKTPATINYILIGVCPFNNLPTTPEKAKRKFVNYSIPPQGRIIARHHWAIWDGQSDHVFFGRFWYTDIFGTEHESGFVLHLKQDGMPAADAPKYWEWT